MRAPSRPGPRGGRVGTALLAALAGLCAAAAPATPPSDGASALAADYALQIRAYLPLLDRSPDAALLQGAIGDVRRAVSEIDQQVASTGAAAIFDPTGVRAGAAAAHLHLALFETRAGDSEAARREVDRARELLGASALDAFRAPWTVRPEPGGPGRAPITRYDMLTFGDYETLLKAEWSAVRSVPLDLNTIPDRDVPGIDLAPSGAPRESDRPLIERARAQLRDAIAANRKTFSIALPPGTYRIAGRPGADLERIFVVPEIAPIDPVVLGADRFALRITPSDPERGPRFFLNGVEVTDRGAMPYGIYRVAADPEFVSDAPSTIRFIPGLGLDNRSRSAWTIFVPRGEMTELRFGGAPLGGHLKD